jgi:hypothetical protein
MGRSIRSERLLREEMGELKPVVILDLPRARIKAVGNKRNRVKFFN